MREHTPETWKPIPGYEGLYEVSDHGGVRSLDRVVAMKNGRRKTLRGQARKLQRLPNGYLTVRLGKGGESVQFYVHRLVLLTFVGDCPRGMETCHNNGVRDDNRLENLRWDTKSANVADTISHGMHNHDSKTHCVRGHEFSEENTRYNEVGHRWCRQCAREKKYYRDESDLFSGECIHGHPFTRENTRIKKNGQRACRECQRIRDRRRSR